MSKEVKEILDRQERLSGDRGTWEGHWQELAEIMLPRRATFTTEGQPGACAANGRGGHTPPARRVGAARPVGVADVANVAGGKNAGAPIPGVRGSHPGVGRRIRGRRIRVRRLPVRGRPTSRLDLPTGPR